MKSFLYYYIFLSEACVYSLDENYKYSLIVIVFLLNFNDDRAKWFSILIYFSAFNLIKLTDPKPRKSQ
ncbi:hypothetical protein HZS_1254 [Henneguya salminicola]|nr:hypothetical protein HZS_1254 [Henneguya salminicola]